MILTDLFFKESFFLFLICKKTKNEDMIVNIVDLFLKMKGKSEKQKINL